MATGFVCRMLSVLAVCSSIRSRAVKPTVHVWHCDLTTDMFFSIV